MVVLEIALFSKLVYFNCIVLTKNCEDVPFLLCCGCKHTESDFSDINANNNDKNDKTLEMFFITFFFIQKLFYCFLTGMYMGGLKSSCDDVISAIADFFYPWYPSTAMQMEEV